MLNNLEALFRARAFRRATRAINHAQKDSWSLAELLRIRLEGGLSTPGEVLAILRTQKTQFDPERKSWERQDVEGMGAASQAARRKEPWS
jgi:hypothetical protein